MSNNFLTHERFLKRAKELYKDDCDYSETDYKTQMTPVVLTCKKHKHRFEQLPRDIFRKRNGCKYCSGHGLSKEDFMKKVEEVWENNFNYSATIFIGMSHNIEFTCSIHNKVLKQIANQHLKGIQACKDCSRESIRSKNAVEFQNKLKNKYFDKIYFVANDYVSARDLCKFHCVEHDFDFEQLPISILSNDVYDCVKCQGKITLEEFVQFVQSSQKFFNRYDYKDTKITTEKTIVDIFCSYHNVNFRQKAALHLAGKTGCAECRKELNFKKKKKREITPFERTNVYFKSLGISFEINKNIENFGNVDFYIDRLHLGLVLKDKKESEDNNKEINGTSIHYLYLSQQDWTNNLPKCKKIVSMTLSLYIGEGNTYKSLANQKNDKKKKRSKRRKHLNNRKVIKSSKSY